MANYLHFKKYTAASTLVASNLNKLLTLKEIGYRTLGRGTVGRGTLGRERKTRVDSRSGDLHKVNSRSGALMHAIATLIR